MLMLERGLTSEKLAMELYYKRQLSLNDQIKINKMLKSNMIHYDNSSEDYDARCERMWEERIKDEDRRR